MYNLLYLITYIYIYYSIFRYIFMLYIMYIYIFRLWNVSTPLNMVDPHPSG